MEQFATLIMVAASSWVIGFSMAILLIAYEVNKKVRVPVRVKTNDLYPPKDNN